MGWKWKKWKDMIPYSSCLCFGRKQWQPIVDDEEAVMRKKSASSIRIDHSALFVRMIGNNKIQTKPIISRERRRSSLIDSDLRILESLDVNHYKTLYSHKFYSLHHGKRKARGSMKGVQGGGILDHRYDGQARCLLSTVGDWSFNVFNLDKLTNGRSLFHMALHIFQEHNFVEIFQLDIVKLMRCFSLIEEGYHSNNHYHNAVHAADVGQAMHCYLHHSKLAAWVSPLETMVGVLSALAHDLDHPGVNQAFLISTSNHLAALYKNSSVLENHHWRSTMGVIHESGVFSHLDRCTFNLIESQIRSLILATDITRQPELLSRFKKLIEADELDLSEPAHRQFTLQIALKCADISNPCRPWDTSMRWSEQICEEFFKQGDTERQLQLPVTPSCDRSKTTVATIQSGFIQFVVSPLFSEWHRFDPTPLSRMMMENLRQNKALWDGMTARAEAASPCQASLSSDEEPAVDTCYKENVDVHQEDVAEDEMLEDRYSPSSHSEDLLLPSCSLRRHSLPPPTSHQETLAFPRRQSLVNHKFKLPSHNHNLMNTAHRKASRRHSLPVSINTPLNASAIDRLADKLVSLTENRKRTGSLTNIEPKTALAKITSYSPETDANIRLSSLNALLAARSAGNQGTLLAGRRTTKSRPHSMKEVTFDIACPVHPNITNASRTSSNSSVLGELQPCSQASRSSRQILKPISVNNVQTCTKIEGTPRARSGSDFGLRPVQFQGALFERPRSMSLHDQESLQPVLLRSIGEWRALSGQVDETAPTYTAPCGYADQDLEVALHAAHALEEEVLTTPLLADHKRRHSSTFHHSPT